MNSAENLSGEQPRPEARDTDPPDCEMGSTLCTSCGLCCTGALHPTAALDPDEVAKALELKLPVLEGSRPLFALPCPRLDGTFCTIYGHRPRVCAGYRCQLLQDLERSAVTLDAALAKVAAAKSLDRQARAQLPPGMTHPEARSIISQPAAPGTSAAELRMRLTVTALNLYLDRHFRNSQDGAMVEFSSIASRKPKLETQ